MDDTFIDEESQRRPINDQVQAELHFVVAHEESVHSHLNKNDAISDVPNSYYKPFKIAKEPRERVVPSDLWAIHENGHLKKILTVLVFLSDEVTDLLDIVDEKVYSPLSMFGSHPIPPLTKGMFTRLCSCCINSNHFNALINAYDHVVLCCRG
jgi:hypothetical protein